MGGSAPVPNSAVTADDLFRFMVQHNISDRRIFEVLCRSLSEARYLQLLRRIDRVNALPKPRGISKEAWEGRKNRAKGRFFEGSSRRLSIARNYKFPSSGEGIGRTIYYSPALSAIRAYHRNSNDPGILSDAIRALELKVRGLEGRKRDRLKKARAENNIRAIQVYARQFGQRRFRLVATPRLQYRSGNVTVTASPDFCVEQRGKKFLIKLDLGRKKPKTEMIRFVLYIIWQAAIAAKLEVEPQAILYLDTISECEHACPKDSPSMRATFRSACEEYETIWSSLT